MRVAEVDIEVCGGSDLDVVTHLDALVPGQCFAEHVGEPAHGGNDGVLDIDRSVAVGEVEQHQAARGAFNEGANRGGVLDSGDQVTLPVAGHGPVLDLGRALSDIDHVLDPDPSLRAAAARLPDRPSSA
ncbi:hypothetical protein RGU42_06160 [Cryobacterium sp. 5B3]|nr:hypothetical protein [Cryobacterium sp. 5B3]MDY7541979.1 hypothetical protein [Cryobacterium sp. 5B3]